MDERAIEELVQRQEGVICRRQVVACGGADHDIRRLLRRRQWVGVHDGVYATHTGPMTWRQRAWAAVLFSGPASALDRESAIRADAGPGWRGCEERAAIRVAIDASRTVTDTADVRVRRVAGLEAKVRWSGSPPRMLVEEATLDYALSRGDDHAAFEALAGSVRARCTTAQRLIAAVERRKRISRRRWFLDVLADIRDGTHSVLEHGYLVHVERAHGLPHSQRQAHERVGRGSTVYRDVVYEEYETAVELDGRPHDHPSQRDADLDRDLELAVQRRTSLRLGWGQVFARGCQTATQVGRVLRDRGWRGNLTPCGPHCAVHDDRAA